MSLSERDFQDLLWCCWQIQTMQRIRKPRNPEGVLCAEMNAQIEAAYILEQLHR